MEGGNLAVADDGSTHFPSELGVLTTSHELPNRPFALGIETSIATAAAAGLATRLQALYPEFWPETVRGLIVNSARWTPSMEKRRRNPNDRAQTLGLLRRFGWGVPNEERAFYSASNALTLIVQDEVDFFQLDNKGGIKLGNMRFYRIPWPVEALQAIPNTEVRMRVTLSYFVEPLPLAATYGRENDYASHHIEFDVCSPEDTDDDAISRLNATYRRSIGGRVTPTREHNAWILGPEARSLGTLRQDEWIGKAADLARMNGIAVYPWHGWWKRVPNSDPQTRLRYSLIVTIETPSTEIAAEVQAELSRIKNKVSTDVETELESLF